MTEGKMLALVIKASDFNEYDRIVTLLCAGGRFTAILKGVKKEKAKLKFAAEPFCFGEFQLTGRDGAMPTVTGCEQQESFFEITKDLTRYYCGCTVLELALWTAQENQENPSLFVCVLKALQQLCVNEVNPAFVLIKFILDVFDNLGQKLVFDRCAECGKAVTEKLYFDFEGGGVLCGGCAGSSASLPDPAVAAVLRIVSSFDFERLRSYKCGDGLIKNTLLFLNGLVQNHIHKIKSIKELVEL